MPFNYQKAAAIHSNKYDYSKVEYVDVQTKVTIICPIHGDFEQTPKNHIYAKAGCKQCSNDAIRSGFDFMKAATIHSDKYDYSKVEYVNTDTKVEINCPNHGPFFQTPYHHINKSMGCPHCKHVNLGKHNALSLDEFIDAAIHIHGGKYEYSRVTYTNAKTRVTITCPNHGPFSQLAGNHLSGNGCPKCSSSVSSSGTRWLADIAPSTTIPEFRIKIGDKVFKVDGYDPETNTVYEYFGVFWHGCPSYTDHTKINPRNKTPFKELYENTQRRIDTIRNAGYNLVYEWGL